MDFLITLYIYMYIMIKYGLFDHPVYIYIQGDQKVSLLLMITIQKHTKIF
jgi:hypothetical protein